jgi:hypothetical protein
MFNAVGGCILIPSIGPDSKRKTVDGLKAVAVAPRVTTKKSLAGHLPLLRTNKLARLRRCWIVGWSHQCLPGSFLFGSTALSRREGR